MSGYTMLMMVATVGVDFGWQPTEDGDLEYIVQIEPQLLELLKLGEPIINEIPEHMRGGRRFRIIVGTGELPRKGEPVRPAPIVRATDQPGPAAFDPNRSPPANSEPDLRSGAFEPNSPFPPMPNSLPKLPNDKRDFNALDPPPLKPDVKFNVGPKSVTNPDSKNAPTEKTKNEFMPLPPELQQNDKRPRPIPDPDDLRGEAPFKGGHLLQIDEPDINAALPIPNTPGANSESREFQPASFSPDKKSETKSKETFTEPTDKSREKSDVAAEKGETGSSISLSVASLLLFASVGINVYLGWLARSFYVRYRKIASQLRSKRVLAV